MPEDKKGKRKLLRKQEQSRFDPADVVIPKRLGGGSLKEYVVFDAMTKEVIHYSFAYINPLIFGGDNGRVLGYDNSHGNHHKHFLGNITPEPFSSLEAHRSKFNNEWYEIAVKFVNGDPI
jgi:Family of unknown function (DUF6516)